MNLFSHVIFYVQDVKKTIEFYEQAFGFKRAFIDPSGHYGQLQSGSASLGFASWDLAKENLKQKFKAISPKELPGLEIAFRTKDIHTSLNEAIQNGAELIASPEEKPWGETVAYVRDFNGILIEICSEMAHCADEHCTSCCD